MSHDKTVTITIDGQAYTLTDDHQQAAALLLLAQVDPGQYDLAKVKNDGEPQVYRDDHPVEMHAGDRFVTVRQSAPVA